MTRSNSNSDSGAAAAAPHHVVFIDTSLDTHLAIAVSDSDTVLDLKKKIVQAHQLCFSKLGEIKISAVKVIRRGRSYHLFDSMLVISAFNGMKKDWFLCVDALSPVECLPLLAITDGPLNAMAEIGGSRDVCETVKDSENSIETLQDLMVEGEGGGTVNPGGETMLPAVKYSKLRDEDNPVENNVSKKRRKRRKMKGQESDTPNLADGNLPPVRTREVDNGRAVTEPEKAIVIRSAQGTSSEGLDRIERAGDFPVQQAVKEKRQSAQDSLEENGSLPLAIKEHETDINLVAPPKSTEKTVEKIGSSKKRKKSHKPKFSSGEELEIVNPEIHEAAPGNDPMVEPQQAVNCDQSGNMLNDTINLYEAGGKEIATVDASKESGEERGGERDLSPEIKENAEVVEGTKNSTKRQTSKEKYVHQTSDRLEQEQSNLLEVERNEAAVMDGNQKSSKDFRHGIRLPGEITENAENIVEKTKRRTKKISSKEKGIDQMSDRHGRMQSNTSKGEEKEIGSVTSEQNSDKEPMDEMGSLEHNTNKAVFEDNVKEKIQKKKTRKGSSKEKKDDQLSGIVDRGDSFMSEAKGRDTPTLDADGKEHGNEMPQMSQIAEKLADTGNFEEKTKKNARQSTKENHAVRIDKEEANFTQAGEAKTMAAVAAESKTYGQHGNEIEEPCQVIEKSVHADISKDKREKGRRWSLNEKDANHSSDGIDKEEASFSQAKGREGVATAAANSRPYELNGNEMDQLHEVTEWSPHANISKEKRKKKTMKLSRGKNTDQSKDGVDTNQSYASQEKGVVMAAIEKSEGEQGSEGPSSPQNMESATKPDNSDQQTQKKTKKQVSKKKGIDRSSDISGKEEESHYQVGEGKELAVVIADKSSKWDHGYNNEEKAEKKTMSRQSSKKSIQSSRNMKSSTLKEDTKNLDNLVNMAIAENSEATDAKAKANDQDLNGQRTVKVATGPTTSGSCVPIQSSEAIKQGIPLHEVAGILLQVSHSDELNNSVDGLHLRENINFRDYFGPQQSQQEVAAPGNSSVGKGPKENRAGSVLKVRQGKRRATSSALTGLNQLNVQMGEEISQLSRCDGLISPVKELSRTPVTRSQASAFPKAKIMEFYGNSEKDSENSAASISGLKRSRKPKKASKSTSSVDRFHVAIRKPSNKSSERKKSLLSLAGAIFKEESSGSSKHDGVENSDASTRTPSDSFSDYSDSDSNGSRRVGGHSKDKSSFKDVKSLSMDRILRSSSGYKKARLAAVSQLNDGETQPDEIVPDSQGNL